MAVLSIAILPCEIVKVTPPAVIDPLTSPGGVTTPSIAMGIRLIARLRRNGLVFEVTAEMARST